ncbi:hypothetical protein [Planktothricoides raciborskii]|uniref:Transposase n=1 Tax=Planktothricoides raciborskii GIHE-MW2 TaxID=2792601 RepID=A0AAU8J6Z4_9CYAN
MATISNPIKLPKGKYSESERKPLEREEAIALSLSKQKQFAGEICQE